MSAFNQSRKNVVAFVIVLMFIVIIAQLARLQLFSSDLRLQADAQGTFRKVIYPDRGIVYDRHKKSILQNTIIYDLMVTPNKLKGVDTFALCKILGIDTAQFNKKVVEVIIKNGRTRTSVFEALLSDDKQAMLNESMYLFTPGFYLQERSVRSYPYDAAANVLGYTAEVDTNFLKKHKDEGYVSGDYAGFTGIERSYEKVLMGERGIEYWKRDNKNRLTEKLEKGKYDTIPIAGNNLHTSLDIELQELGDERPHLEVALRHPERVVGHEDRGRIEQRQAGVLLQGVGYTELADEHRLGAARGYVLHGGGLIGRLLQLRLREV